MDRDEDRDSKLRGGSWRYSAGAKGVNRVTVYERPDARSLFIEWWEDGERKRRSLKNFVGGPVTDRAVGVMMAEKVAREQFRNGKQAVAEIVFRAHRLRGVEQELEDVMTLPDDELLKHRLPAAPMVGIYFLMWGDEVTYVGRSTDVTRRLGRHRRNPPAKWNAVAFQPAQPDNLERLEAFFIARFDPVGNRWAGHLEREDETLLPAPTPPAPEVGR